ncbi:MAG: DUF1987 domain-containing protein [Cyclobacteriaceae bacterium]|nr:DUF1987 domain-containing protein [Cyclobacteriaceae bacterium]
MEILNIEGAEDTPKIILDKGNGIFEISGRSLPEDCAEFYKPVLEWIRSYSGDSNASTDFVFNLEYFNTASSKLILDILSALNDVKGTTVFWHYQEDDEDMMEAGEEYRDLVEMPFELKSY